MPVDRINESKKAIVGTVRLREPLKKRKIPACVYNPNVDCKLPEHRFKICATCARAEKFKMNADVKQVFGKIKSMAIMMMKDAPPVNQGRLI